MARKNTKLEAEGAEYLVVAQLLIQGIPAYKAYQYMPTYDLVADNPQTNRSAHISVKSRWSTKADCFIIRDIACDFVVVVKLNCGVGDIRQTPHPEFFVLPAKILEKVPRGERVKKVQFKNIDGFDKYRDRWDLIKDFLAR